MARPALHDLHLFLHGMFANIPIGSLHSFKNISNKTAPLSLAKNLRFFTPWHPSADPAYVPVPAITPVDFHLFLISPSQDQLQLSGTSPRTPGVRGPFSIKER